MEVINRNHVIAEINDLKRAKGEVFSDFDKYLDLPHSKLESELMNGVYRPLVKKFLDARKRKLENYGYGIYSRYTGTSNPIVSSVRKLLSFNNPIIPGPIAIGIYETIKEHEKSNGRLEFILYLKAFNDESEGIPDDVLGELIGAH